MGRKKAAPVVKASVLRDDVYQSNPLIQARKDFDIIGMRLFLLGLRGLNPHFSDNDKFYDEKFEEVFIPTAKLTNLLGGNTWYLHDLEQICDKFFDAKIHLRDEDGGFTLMHIFRQLKYVPKEGLYLQFDELMRPYILDLFESNGYTKIGIEQIFRLSSPYAVRLVELMLQYQNIAAMKERKLIERTLAVEEIRFALNISAGAYKDRLDNFRKRILDDPIREINEKTLYQMSYQTEKAGRRVGGFKFFMDVSALPEAESVAAEFCNALSALSGLGFNQKSALAILKKCDGESDCLKRIKRAKKALAEQKKAGQITNELGFLRKAIEENWEAPVAREQKLPYPPAQSKANPTGTYKPPPRQEFKINPEVLESLPSAEEFREGETPVSVNLVEAYKNAITSGKSEGVVTDLLLRINGLTVKRFTELYMKQK